MFRFKDPAVAEHPFVDQGKDVQTRGIDEGQPREVEHHAGRRRLGELGQVIVDPVAAEQVELAPERNDRGAVLFGQAGR